MFETLDYTPISLSRGKIVCECASASGSVCQIALEGAAFRANGASFALKAAPFTPNGAPFAPKGAPFALKGTAFALKGAPFALKGAALEAKGAAFAVKAAPFALEGEHFGLIFQPFLVCEGVCGRIVSVLSPRGEDVAACGEARVEEACAGAPDGNVCLVVAVVVALRYEVVRESPTHVLYDAAAAQAHVPEEVCAARVDVRDR